MVEPDDAASSLSASVLSASALGVSTLSSEAGSAYDVLAADYARLLPDLSAEAPGERAMLERFAREAAARGGQILDAGCGTGRVARWLAARGLQVTGMDVSAEMIAQARAADADPSGAARSGAIDYIVGELSALPAADASQDAVLLWYSLIHLPRAEHDAVWAEVARVLRPEGIVLVAVQEGRGEVDLAEFYAGLGHEVTLRRWRHTAASLISGAAAHGLHSRLCRVRGPRGRERDGQAVVLFGR